jgi:DNA-binding MarR family transcriptional regulator
MSLPVDQDARRQQEEESAELAAELRVVLAQLFRRLRSENALPLSHMVVLARLDGGPLTATALARAEHVRPQSMAQTLAEVREAGLVSRRPDPDDGRRILIELTEAGRKSLHEARRRREDWLAEMLDGVLAVRERRALAAALPVLRRLARADAATTS